MTEIVVDGTVGDFRARAAALLLARIAPSDVVFRTRGDQQLSLFAESSSLPSTIAPLPRMPRSLWPLVERALYHRDPHRYALAYRVLYRVCFIEPELLAFAGDPDVRRLRHLADSVDREVHRMHAFVRFRRMEDPDGEPRYVAWYCPTHPVLPLAVPFFVERFPHMRWTLMTPDARASWDGAALTFGPGAPRSDVADDDTESLFRDYYAATFNPARVNLPLLRRHVPARYLVQLPELDVVRTLARAAPEQVRAMVHPPASAATAYLPGHRSLTELRAALPSCAACDICARATAPVFGEGPAGAKIVLVGEQPGDAEDVAGRPFVGPAGRLLDELLDEAGLDRRTLYLTNAVKGFKWRPDGPKRRLHERPSAREIRACNGWVMAEVAAVRPARVVCLGASAAQSFLGAGFRLSRSRGKVQRTPEVPWLLPTWHPAAILRAEPARAQELRAELLGDLRSVWSSTPID